MNFVSIKELSKEQISSLITRALEFKKGTALELKESIANIFLEPSTRTMLSFRKAQNNLKMEVYDVNIANSSFKKGETLEDTLLNLQAMGINNFVIRNTVEGYWKDFKGKFNIINGGDGTKNHPSQALLDATTIYEHFGTLENLKVLIVGDVKHSRVYHSNKDLLEKFNSTVDMTGPKELGGDGEDISEKLNQYDVVMFLRIQHERHSQEFSVEEYNKHFGLNINNVNNLKDNAIFLHPGPINRDVEIASELLYDHPKNKILDQVENGVYSRMAIMEFVCKNM